MNKLFERIEKYDAVIIFGASELGQLIYREIQPFCQRHAKPIVFADNSYKKQSAEKRVYKPHEALSKVEKPIWIIASEFHSKQISEQLKDMGILNAEVVHDVAAVLKRKTEADKLRRLTPQKQLKLLTLYIYDGCNLNCKGCNVFIPLCPKRAWTVETAEFKKDVERLAELFGNNIEILELMGGEPLLHPRLAELISAVRKQFPCVNIRIVTNGLLLPKMGDDFWNSCRVNDALISVTPYPVTLDLDKINELALRKNAKIEFFGIGTEKTSWHFAYDPAGGQHPAESFNFCRMANNCVSLKSGKIATCPPILYASYFGDYFENGMTASDADTIDIHKVRSGQEILEFVAKPVPFCRFCDVKHRTYDNPWRTSKREISEWVIEK
jgi:hypothetical protein